jgi:hypothetical protein
MISPGECETIHAVYPSSNQRLSRPRWQTRKQTPTATPSQASAHQYRLVLESGPFVEGVAVECTDTKYGKAVKSGNSTGGKTFVSIFT